jgi:hypothetical protein
LSFHFSLRLLKSKLFWCRVSGPQCSSTVLMSACTSCATNRRRFRWPSRSAFAMAPHCPSGPISVPFFLPSKHSESSPKLQSSGGSLLSSSFAAGVTSPFDLIKTRMQVQCAESGGYTSIYQAFKSIGQNEGIRAYFKGMIRSPISLPPNPFDPI